MCVLALVQPCRWLKILKTHWPSPSASATPPVLGPYNWIPALYHPLLVFIASDLLNILHYHPCNHDGVNFRQWMCGLWAVLSYVLSFVTHLMNFVYLRVLHWIWEATASKFPVCVNPHSPSLMAIPWEENELLLETAWKFAAPKGIIWLLCPSYCWPLSLLEPLCVCPTLPPSSKC